MSLRGRCSFAQSNPTFYEEIAPLHLRQVQVSSPKNGFSQQHKINMTILSIDHVQLAMPIGEEDQARAFYVNVLGFFEVPKPTELATRGGAWFESKNVKLHLGIDLDFHPARKAHPAFIVDDLDAIIAKVEKAHYKTDTSQPPLDGYKRAHVFDPFGNRIELMEKL